MLLSQFSGVFLVGKNYAVVVLVFCQFFDHHLDLVSVLYCLVDDDCGIRVPERASSPARRKSPPSNALAIMPRTIKVETEPVQHTFPARDYLQLYVISCQHLHYWICAAIATPIGDRKGAHVRILRFVRGRLCGPVDFNIASCPDGADRAAAAMAGGEDSAPRQARDGTLGEPTSGTTTAAGGRGEAGETGNTKAKPMQHRGAMSSMP